MTSENKKSKTDKHHHCGRNGKFLKIKTKLKFFSFYNSSLRQHFKKQLLNDINKF